MPNVILLRTPAESPPDPYESVLRDASFNVFSIPVLETSFVNLPDLQSVISEGPKHNSYTGVIITSKRSCEAWTAATKSLLTSLSSDDASRKELNASLASWTETPFYVVGKATAAALDVFRELCSDSDRNISLDIRGKETGNGEQLAQFILEDTRRDTTNKNLLYLTGDKNRDTIPQIFNSDAAQGLRIRLRSLQVYETHGATEFAKNIGSFMTQVVQARQDNIWWIVFLAPSSSQFAYPILRKYFRFTHKDASPDADITLSLPIARVAAIGHVTSSYLEEKLNIHVDATASKPSPEALSAAISSAIQ